MNIKAVISMAFAGSLMTGTALGDTINVDPGESIQQKINQANPGDVVVVQPGTYSPFQITKDNITVKSAVPGGAHIVATHGGQPAISAYGQNNIAVLDFRVTSKGGDGIKMGGSASGGNANMANNIRIEGNTIESAWLDGIKLFQASGVSVEANDILMSGAAGPAGHGANGNGDGGIDFVQVVNSEILDNTITSRGWGCMMIKNGSNNVEIDGNDLVKCEVNGIDMAAGSSGEAAAANKSGLIAYNNTISNNTIDGGSGCAIKLGEDTKNIRVENSNELASENCNNGRSNGSTATGADGTEGSGYAEGESTDGDGQSQTDSLLHLASSTSSCGTEAGAAMSAVGAASGFFSGGRATVAAQLAQQVQLIFHSMCASEQLAAQVKMIQGLNINTASDVQAAMVLIQNVLGASQRVSYELAKADADWNRVFMETNGLQQMPFELAVPGIGKRYAEMRDYSNDAMREAARVRALAVSNMKSGNARTRQAADASAAAVGATQAVQAGNLLVLETRQELQGMHQTMLSYNEAQSRINQENRIQAVLSDIFMAKNLESMNPDKTPTQGTVMWNKERQSVVADVPKPTHASPRQNYNPSAFPSGPVGFGQGSVVGTSSATLSN